MFAKVLISQKERYPVNVYFCFQISRSIYKLKMAAQLIYLKAWSLSFDHLHQKIRDFVKNLLLIVILTGRNRSGGVAIKLLSKLRHFADVHAHCLKCITL